MTVMAYDPGADPQPTTAPKKLPVVGQPNTQTFGPGNNLIGTQFSPTPSTRTQAAGGVADNAMQTYAGWQPNGQLPTLYGQANSQVQSLTAPAYQPVVATDQTGTRNYMNQAGNLSGTGTTGGFGFGGDTGTVRGQLTSQLNTALNTTPDRAKLAGDAYDLLLQRNAPQEFADDRRYAQQQAALGRAGSGMFNSGLADIATQRETTRDQARRDLANNAASLALNDQAQKVGLAQGVLGQLGGLDLSASGENRGWAGLNNAERNSAFGRSLDLAGLENNLANQTRRDALTERDARRTADLYANDLGMQKADATRGYANDLGNLDQTNFNNRRQIFGDTSGYENNLYNRDMGNLDFMRGERNYQYGLSRDAQGDAINQYNAQEGQYGSDFNRGLDLFNAGYGWNPADLYGQRGDRASQNAATAGQGIGDLLAAWGRRRGSQPAGTGGPPDALGDYSTGLKGDLMDISNMIPNVTAPNYDPRRYLNYTVG